MKHVSVAEIIRVLTSSLSFIFDNLKCDENQGIYSSENLTVYFQIPSMFFDFQNNLLVESGLPLLSLQIGETEAQVIQDMLELRWLVNHKATTRTQSCLCLLSIKWLFYDIVGTNVSEFVLQHIKNRNATYSSLHEQLTFF